MDMPPLRSDGRPENTRLEDGAEERGLYFDQWANERSSWNGFSPSTGIAVNPQSALTLSAYFSAINVLSTDLACLPFKVYRSRKSGGRDEVRDDPRSEFLSSSPDGETTAMRQRQAMLAHMLGRGNGYAELGMSGGEIDGIYLLDPSTEPGRRSQDKKLYYRLPDGTTRPPYKILHIAGLGFDGLCGYSVARMARQSIKLGLSAEGFGVGFFDNGVTASGHFEIPHKMDGPAQDEFRRNINAAHAGVSNAFKFMMLSNGAKWVSHSINPEDGQWLATRQFQVVEIARMFRLPPHKIGDYTQSHLSNIEQANIDYMTTVLMPWCVSIEQEYNRKLFTREERKRGYFAENLMQAFLRGDMNARAAFYQIMFGLGVFTPNRIAELENENPLGPEGDERFLTVQAQPFKTVLNPPDLSPEPAPAPEVPAVNGARFNSNGDHHEGH